MTNLPTPTYEHPVCQFVGTPEPFVWSETAELVRLGVPMTLLASFATGARRGEGYYYLPSLIDPAGQPVRTQVLSAGLPGNRAVRWLWLALLGMVLALKQLFVRPRRLWRCWRVAGSFKHFCHALRARRLIARWQPAVLYTHFAFLDARTMAGAAVLGDIPFVMVTHASDIYQPSPQQQTFLQQVLLHCARLLTVAEHNLHVLSRYLDADLLRQKAAVRRMGVDVQQFDSPSPADLFARPMRICTLPSGFVPQKGFPILVEAMSQLIRSGLDLKLLVIGGSVQPDRVEQARQRICNAGIQDHVEFTGYVLPADVPRRVCEAALFVLPCMPDESGRTDCIPIALMEAMALRRLVISTPVGGIPELITHGQDGLLVPSKDADALAEAIRKVYDDPARYADLPERARETVCERYNVRKTARQMAEHLGFSST